MNGTSKKRLPWLLLCFLLLAVTLGLRVWLSGTTEEPLAPRQTPAVVTFALETAPITTTPHPTARIAPVATPLPTLKPLPSATIAPVIRAPVQREVIYTNETYALASDMVYIYRMHQSDGMELIREKIAELKELDPDLGAMWENIMLYWDYANTELPVNLHTLPEDLPQDNSLCLVVLGFQLLPDGSMSPELIGRCETALAAAEQYPNAYVAVTGGGTAYGNSAVTEAGVMADWLIANGVDESRLIVENRSLTTAENATYLTAILMERYPSIRSLAIISSDYHIAMGSILFNTTAQIEAYRRGEAPFAVVSNAAWPVPEMAGTENAVKQATFVWSVADPKL